MKLGWDVIYRCPKSLQSRDYEKGKDMAAPLRESGAIRKTIDYFAADAPKKPTSYLHHLDELPRNLITNYAHNQKVDHQEGYFWFIGRKLHKDEAPFTIFIERNTTYNQFSLAKFIISEKNNLLNYYQYLEFSKGRL